MTEIPGVARKSANGWAAAVAVIAAILGLLAAMVQPMHQRIDSLRLQLLEFKEELQRITDRERTSAQSLATISERFKEVETQFKLKGEVYETRFAANERRIDMGERDGNPRHDERISTLERRNGINREEVK